MNKFEYLSKCDKYGGPCKDCDGNNQGYMVRWDLWRKYVGKISSGFVCVTCFKKRLGRPLEVEDFLLSAPINHGFFGFNCKVYCGLV